MCVYSMCRQACACPSKMQTYEDFLSEDQTEGIFTMRGREVERLSLKRERERLKMMITAKREEEGYIERN